MAVAKPSLAQFSEKHTILNPAAALQNPFVVCIPISLTYDIRGTQFELWGQICGACPLDVFNIIVVALVCAAHDFRLVELAYFLGGADTAELRDWGDATRASQSVRM